MAQYKEDKGKRLTKMAEDKLKKEAEPPVNKKEGKDKEKTDDKANSKLQVLTLLNFFLCSLQLSTIFHLLIKTKISTNKKVSCFKSLRFCVYHANKC